MRTTMNLDDEQVSRAKERTGIRERTAVVYEGLRALVARESARRLAKLGGIDQSSKAGPRRRSRPA